MHFFTNFICHICIHILTSYMYNIYTVHIHTICTCKCGMFYGTAYVLGYSQHCNIVWGRCLGKAKYLKGTIEKMNKTCNLSCLYRKHIGDSFRISPSFLPPRIIIFTYLFCLTHPAFSRQQDNGWNQGLYCWIWDSWKVWEYNICLACHEVTPHPP